MTWLIKWADKEYQEIDSSLNACAISFVQELLEKDKSYIIETVQKARTQWKKIDVSALVNNEYFLVIEDKKSTKEHSNQLNRYSESARKHYEKSDIEIKPVYFKMEGQGEYQDIKDAGFSVFQRSKMLSILEYYINSTEKAKQNDIVVDYYNDLENLNNEIKSYREEPLNKWDSHSWKGFYSELQKHIEGNWDYVSNRAGGFLGFWWHIKKFPIDGKEFEYYLQLEQDKFVFKVCTDSPDTEKRKEIQEFYRRYLYKKANELNIEIYQFGRVGTHMGVAKLKPEYRITDENGLLDLPATVENLKEIMKLVDETEKEIKAHNKSV